MENLPHFNSIDTFDTLRGTTVVVKADEQSTKIKAGDPFVVDGFLFKVKEVNRYPDLINNSFSRIGLVIKMPDDLMLIAFGA